ncbi:MAG: hypothetical protein LBU86_05170 [Oscillospiraceae bacterium]|jgi:hypothetical protein|nr:hypothetical protein [Oscillospiraceae bacterium]
MKKKSTQVAMGGMFSALCVTLMFFTGIVPFATYALPMLAGAFLIPIVVELGGGTAVTVYASVAFLSAFVVADKEAAMLFIVFFGHYPILRRSLERLRPGALRLMVKLAVFNVTVVGGFLFTAHILGVAEILGGFGDLGGYTMPALLLIANIFFLVYDRALVRYYSLYIYRFRPRFLRRQSM